MERSCDVMVEHLNGKDYYYEYTHGRFASEKDANTFLNEKEIETALIIEEEFRDYDEQGVDCPKLSRSSQSVRLSVYTDNNELVYSHTVSREVRLGIDCLHITVTENGVCKEWFYYKERPAYRISYEDADGNIRIVARFALKTDAEKALSVLSEDYMKDICFDCSTKYFDIATGEWKFNNN